MYELKILQDYRNTFYLIDEKELLALNLRRETHTSKPEDLNLFIYIDSTVKREYVAIDNLHGDFFVENFKILNDALIWLSGLKEVEPLQKAEDSSFWW